MYKRPILSQISQIYADKRQFGTNGSAKADAADLAEKDLFDIG
jgi:hypothetical protein